MLKKIKKYILVGIAGIILTLSLSVGLASAQADIQDNTCQGANNLEFGNANNNSCSESTLGQPQDEVNSLITTIINIFSIIVGIVAVIMIIYGGFQYITSGGDSSKVTGARNTILYAIIGLIIVALSQFIVRFVLAETVN